MKNAKTIKRGMVMTTQKQTSTPIVLASLPYGGRNIDDVIAECENEIREYMASAPLTDLKTWNKKNKYYGETWATVAERNAGYFSVVGIEGNLSGVPVAFFELGNGTRESARRFAKDFAAGKIFTVINADLWRRYVKAAGLPAARSSALAAHGRSSGLLPTGKEISAADLLALYSSCRAIADIVKD